MYYYLWLNFALPLRVFLVASTVGSRKFRFAEFQIEGLESQNHCLRSLQNALWKFKSPRGWPNSSRLNFSKLTILRNE